MQTISLLIMEDDEVSRKILVAIATKLFMFPYKRAAPIDSIPETARLYGMLPEQTAIFGALHATDNLLSSKVYVYWQVMVWVTAGTPCESFYSNSKSTRYQRWLVFGSSTYYLYAFVASILAALMSSLI